MPFRVNRHRLKWLGITLVLLLMLLFVFFLGFELTKTDTALRKDFEADSLSIDIEYVNINGFRSRYIKANTDSVQKPLIVFVHGAPGGCTAFSSYLKDVELRQLAHLISVDRPGYGPEDEGRAEVSIRKQSEFLDEVIRRNNEDRGVFIVSHSFGGPIACLSAISLQEVVKGHLMLSPVISADHEKIFWYSSIPVLWPFRLIVSNELKVAAYEKLAHREEIRAYKHYWKEITSPTIHMHGKKDWLAPFENVAFCRQTFNETVYEAVILENSSHFIPWTQRIRVKNEILRMLSSYQVSH